jgi:hypothetical protein
MPKKSKDSSRKDALLAEVKQEMQRPRVTESAHMRKEASEAAPSGIPRSPKEIAMRNNWLAFLQSDDADTLAGSPKKK